MAFINLEMWFNNMKKYKVKVPVDYVMGYLKYGHLECDVEAESKEEALEKAMDYDDFELVVDSYRVEDYGDKLWQDAEIKEVI